MSKIVIDGWVARDDDKADWRNLYKDKPAMTSHGQYVGSLLKDLTGTLLRRIALLPGQKRKVKITVEVEE